MCYVFLAVFVFVFVVVVVLFLFVFVLLLLLVLGGGGSLFFHSCKFKLTELLVSIYIYRARER